jgi:DNA-binding transcriptional ArsR family regulator
LSTRSTDGADVFHPKAVEPPHDEAAERAVLGSILLDNGSLPSARAILTAEDFYRTSHADIYRAMLQLADADGPIDSVSLLARVPASIGPAVSRLLDGIPRAANVAHHAGTVREKAWRRRLGDALQKAFSLASNGVDLDEVLKGLRPVEDLMRDGGSLGGRVLRRYDAQKKPVGRRMITRELPTSAVVLEAGDGGTGKSYAALERAHAIAAGIGEFGREGVNRDPYPVLILDAENGEDLMVARLHAIARGSGTEAQLPSIMDRLVILDGFGFNLDSDSDMAALHREIRQLEPVLVILDSAAALHHRNENDSIEIRGLMDGRIRPLTRVCGSCVEVLHHLRKKGGLADLDNGAQRVRGASGWVDGADEVFVLRAAADEKIIIEHPKGRIAGSSRPFVLRKELPPPGCPPADGRSRIIDIGSPEAALNKAGAARLHIFEALAAGSAIEAGELDERVRRAAGCSERTAREVRSKLEEEGLIRVIQQGKTRLVARSEDVDG